MQEVASQINGTQFYDALAAIVTKTPSGMVSVKHGMIVRKFFFHQGHCVAVRSTETQELPGYFLHQQQHLSAEPFQRYKRLADQPNARQWDLATMELNWTDAEIFEAKKKHLFHVLTSLSLHTPHHVSFVEQNFSKEVPLLTSSFSMLLFKSAHWPENAALNRLPFLANNSETLLAWTDHQYTHLLPNEAKHLQSLIGKKATWANVQNQTQLSKIRLQTWMIFLTTLGIVQVQDEPGKRKPPAQEFGWSSSHMKNIQIFGQKLQQNNLKEAIDFGHKQWLEDKNQHRLSIIMIETIFNHDLVQEKQYQKMAFSILEHNMQHFTSQYESFFLLGKLCYLLGQPVHAIKSLSRALHLRPDLGSLRDFIIFHAKDLGSHVVLECLSTHIHTMNHYSLLGVDSQSSMREITLAYRQCCKHFHPDRFYRLNLQHISDQAKNVFKKMVAAHRILKHPRRRQQYDLELSPDAQKETNQATPISPAAKPFYELGTLKMREKDFESAIFQFRMAFQLDPNHRPTQDQLAKAKAKQQEKERV